MRAYPEGTSCGGAAGGSKSVTNLDGLEMYVSSTARDGVVDSGTRLWFRQSGSRVVARYGGGAIRRGLLVGSVADSRLEFRFTQVEASGEVHGGRSVCEVRRRPDGCIRVVEHFNWRTRSGSGMNVFDEVTAC